MWIALVLFYGISKAVRDACKKKALEISNLMEVLFLYTALSFVLAAPFCGNVFDLEISVLLWVLLKAAFVFGAWLLSFSAISKMPMSMYGVMDMSGILFSVIMGITLLNEPFGIWQVAGLLFVLVGLLLVSMTKNDGSGNSVKSSIILIMIVSCLLNSMSGTMDKLLMASGKLTSGQMQFWYMLFMTLMYLAFILIRKIPVRVSTIKTNKWIIVMAVLFVLADRALFIANGDESSKLTIMTLLKQSNGITSIIIGKVFFHEKKTLARMGCAGLIIVGIVLSFF